MTDSAVLHPLQNAKASMSCKLLIHQPININANPSATTPAFRRHGLK
jgi:hypothetical protein